MLSQVSSKREFLYVLTTPLQNNQLNRSEMIKRKWQRKNTFELQYTSKLPHTRLFNWYYFRIEVLSLCQKLSRQEIFTEFHVTIFENKPPSWLQPLVSLQLVFFVYAIKIKRWLTPISRKNFQWLLPDLRYEI